VLSTLKCVYYFQKQLSERQEEVRWSHTFVWWL